MKQNRCERDSQRMKQKNRCERDSHVVTAEVLSDAKAQSKPKREIVEVDVEKPNMENTEEVEAKESES